MLRVPVVTVKANVHIIHSILINAVILFAIKKLIVNIADVYIQCMLL